VCRGEEGLTDHRGDAGVGAGGGKPGINASDGARSTSTSLLTSSLPKWGQHDTNNDEDGRDGRSGEVWRHGVPEDNPSLENPVRRI
jgi:hypothetical protein